MSRYLCASVLFILLLSGNAFAHRLVVFADHEGGDLKGQAYFSGGRACRHCKITVHDAAGNLLATTRTDRAGEFSLPAPKAPLPWRVRLRASGGHAAQTIVQGREAAKPGHLASKKTPASKKPSLNSVTTVARCQDKRLEKAIAKLIAVQLAPIRRKLDRLVQGQQEPGLREIIGGLGWIAGLLGLGAYLLSWRRQR